MGRSANLLATGASRVSWSPAIGLNNTGISNPVANPMITTSYRAVGYDGFNCFTDTAFVLVTVGKYPTVNLGPDQSLLAGTVLPLKTDIQNGPISTWSWSPAKDLSCGACALPNAVIKNNISYVVNVKNIYGCEASDTIQIKVFCEDSQLFVPNAFTPDGDGINDVLMVRGKGIVSVKYFRVFNRWGELVFERSDFPPNNITYGWNGKIRGAVGQSDIYVYTAAVICEAGATFVYKGNTSIIK
jgi:gliding motility-associated-like protein